MGPGNVAEQGGLAQLAPAVDKAAVGRPRQDVSHLSFAPEEHLLRDLPGIGRVRLDPAIGEAAFEDCAGAGLAPRGGEGDERLVDEKGRDGLSAQALCELVAPRNINDGWQTFLESKTKTAA